MKLNIVVAASENNVIGKNNQLLWSLPNDMKFFKNTTWAQTIIMGRKTYESLDKPLTGRTNIVITSKTDWKPDDVIVVNSLPAALEAAKATEVKEAYVIGGGEIYKQSLPITQRVYLTRVHASFEGDTSFPELPSNEWELHSQLNFDKDENHAYAYSFEIWDRKNK